MAPRSLLFLAPLLLAGLGTSQVSASTKYISQAKPYLDPIPSRLAVVSPPKLGGSYSLSVHQSWRQRNGAGEDCILAFGLKNPSVPIPALGGWLYCSGEILLLMPQNALGIPVLATKSYSIPATKGLLGFTFYNQVYCASPKGASPVLSRGVLAIVGL